MISYAFSDGTDEVGLYRAGSVAPAGFYAREDSFSDSVIEVRDGDILPASCDGHVALYRRVGLTGAMLYETLQFSEA